MGSLEVSGGDSSNDEFDRTFLRRAINIALDDREGCGPFGAVIVQNGQILAEGRNSVVADTDPTAHAEVLAIRTAALKLQSHVLSGCTVYCSCEPCPMCLAALYWAHVDRCVFGATRSDARDAGFDDAAIYSEVNLDPIRRTMPMSNIHVDNCCDPFVLWQKNVKHVCY